MSSSQLPADAAVENHDEPQSSALYIPWYGLGTPTIGPLLKVDVIASELNMLVDSVLGRLWLWVWV